MLRVPKESSDEECAVALATFVALSRFTIANEKAEEVREAFRQRPHLVDDAPGFVRLEVLSPVESPKEIWLLTWWTDAASFETWHRSHLYRESHKGIPKGLKLVPKSAEVIYLQHVCS